MVRLTVNCHFIIFECIFVVFLDLVIDYNDFIPSRVYCCFSDPLVNISIEIINQISLPKLFKNEIKFECSHPAISVVSEHQYRSVPLLLFPQLCCRRNMERLLSGRTLLPPVLLQLLIQQLSAFSRQHLSASFLHPASFLPDLFSHHISVHSCMAEILL